MELNFTTTLIICTTLLSYQPYLRILLTLQSCFNNVDYELSAHDAFLE